MPSFKSALFAVAAAFVATAHADYSINITAVPLSTRKAWCQDELNTCPIICQQVEPRTYLVNTCDPVTLTYGCLCGDNNRPNMSEYSLTLPYHVCQEYGNQCVKACGQGANQCASDCRENNPCGAQNPTRVNTTSTSTGAPTATGTSAETSGVIFDGFGGSGSGSSGSDSGSGSGSGAAALEMGRSAGLAIVVGGLVGAFALLL